ncbi:DUF445 domain-containing protein [uncultured Nocardioides sp.]|uniref:DUF445 domain-containing protein n=1 Tax=uncultured Nocardioides sp. TaxID=198441 RepID=UPI0026274EA3|nr:DUF445 domain-containing protein [uncultured Nocardioides sp.]
MTTVTRAPMVQADPAADELRRRGLRRMRLVATSLLVLAAVVYVATLGQDGVLGFVNAGAEASMVGAIADWFAVTALFRHPLGLPIPHTALIPRRKDDLGKGLQEFVGENFLAEAVVREQVLGAEPSRRVGTWLSQPANARRVVDEAVEIATIGLSKIRDDQIADLVEGAVLPRFREERVAPLAGSLLAEVVRDRVHHGLVDLALGEMYRWLAENPDRFAEIVGSRAPWWAPQSLNEAVTGRLHTEALRWLGDIRDDPDHDARAALDSLLEQLAQDLLFDPATQERAERLKDRVLEHPQVLATAVSLWQAFRRALLTSLREKDGEVHRRLLRELTAFAERLVTEADLRERLDTRVADAAVFVVSRYGEEVTAVISRTIQRWDGKEASQRIELHVGRDLQFIRINGTVVGGLVGVVIHAVAVLLG